MISLHLFNRILIYVLHSLCFLICSGFKDFSIIPVLTTIYLYCINFHIKTLTLRRGDISSRITCPHMPIKLFSKVLFEYSIFLKYCHILFNYHVSIRFLPNHDIGIPKNFHKILSSTYFQMIVVDMVY